LVFPLDRFERVGPIVSEVDLETSHLQERLQNPADMRFVVGD
jgi:hypothetical protein